MNPFLHSIKLNTFLIFLLIIGSPALLMAHGVSASDQQTMLEGGILAHIWIGAKHMVEQKPSVATLH